MSATKVHVADGTYRDLRWFVERCSDADHPVITITGNLGTRYVHEAIEMPGASLAKVKRLVDTIIAAPERAKKAPRRRV